MTDLGSSDQAFSTATYSFGSTSFSGYLGSKGYSHSRRALASWGQIRLGSAKCASSVNVIDKYRRKTINIHESVLNQTSYALRNLNTYTDNQGAATATFSCGQLMTTDDNSQIQQVTLGCTDDNSPYTCGDCDPLNLFDCQEALQPSPSGSMQVNLKYTRQCNTWMNTTSPPEPLTLTAQECSHERQYQYERSSKQVATVALVLGLMIAFKETIKLLMITTIPFTDVVRKHPSRFKYCLTSPFAMFLFLKAEYKELIQLTFISQDPTWPTLIDLLLEDGKRSHLPLSLTCMWQGPNCFSQCIKQFTLRSRVWYTSLWRLAF